MDFIQKTNINAYQFLDSHKVNDEWRILIIILVFNRPFHYYVLLSIAV